MLFSASKIFRPFALSISRRQFCIRVVPETDPTPPIVTWDDVARAKRKQNTRWSNMAADAIEKNKGTFILPLELASITSNKSWVARDSLVAASHAFRFPDITVQKVLDPDEPKSIMKFLKDPSKPTITLFNVFMGVIFQDRTRALTWDAVFRKHFGENKQCQTYHMTCYDGLLLSRESMKQQTMKALNAVFAAQPLEERHVLVCFDEKWAALRKGIGMAQARPNHVMLLDSEARIRWTASHECTPEEAEQLVVVVNQLLKEQTEALD